MSILSLKQDSIRRELDTSTSSLPIINENATLSLPLSDEAKDDSSTSILDNPNETSLDDSSILAPDSASPSLDGYPATGSRSPTKSHVERFKHQRNFSDTTLSSFLPNIDDSSISLGFNKLSETTVSPLGQNSIFELTHSMNYKSKATSTGLLSITSSPASVSLRGPTSRDIPQTSLSTITKVKNSQFKPYLNSIEDSYKTFRSNRSLTESTLEAFINQLSNEDKKKQKLTFETDSVNSNCELDEEEEADLDSNSLSNIPEVYFSDDFRLDNPRIFKEVTENSTILKETVDFNEDGARKSLINNDQLQEKMSSYLDIVEVHLIHEISKSSGSFFSALDDLKDITSQSKKLAGQLKTLDSDIESLETNQTKSGIEILKLIQKRNNVEKLEQATLQIYTILHQADLAESSYFNANYEKSLEITDSVFALIQGNNPPHPLITKLTRKWPHPLINLDKVPALSKLKRLLLNLVMEIGDSYEKLFDNFLINDIREHYENVSKTETIDRLNSNLVKQKGKRSSRQFNSHQVNNEFKSQLRGYLSGLARCGKIDSAFKKYEDSFLKELKSIIKSNLPTDILEIGRDSNSVRSDATRSTSTQQSGNGALVNNVKALTPREFEDMLITIYTQLSEAFGKLTAHKKVLLEMALDALADQDPQFLDRQPDIIVNLDVTSAINNALILTQERMARILRVRNAQNSMISLDFFLRFYSVNTMFVSECEIISNGTAPAMELQNVINSQLQKFNFQFHKTNMKILTDKIEKEQWKEGKLSSSVQNLLNEIVEASTDDFDEDKWMHTLKISFDNNAVSSNLQTQDEKRSTLTINEKSIIVPEVAGDILKIIQNYEVLKMQFPKFDENNIIELLKLLNLKIHHTVLGAQATKTAGLKHITSKNLATTSQFLDFLAILTPYIKEMFGRLTKSNKFKEEEFEKVQSLFEDQKKEIFDKLVSLMTDRVNIHAIEIKNTDWSQLLSQQQTHKYMETLVKETLTIARVLQRYFPEEQYALLLSRIFDQYKRSLTDIYLQVRLKDSIEKAVMMKDVDYFREKLADVTGYGNSGQVIWENVNSMPTDEDTRMEQVMINNAMAEAKPASKNMFGIGKKASTAPDVDVSTTTEFDASAGHGKKKEEEEEDENETSTNNKITGSPDPNTEDFENEEKEEFSTEKEEESGMGGDSPETKET